MLIGVIDLGLGNIGSVKNIIEKVGGKVSLLSSPEELLSVDKLVFPGVGAYDKTMTQLDEGGWIDLLNKRVIEDKAPILGICLGMQLFTSGSEEGVRKGLGWISGRTVRFDLDKMNASLRIPHMGWNIADIKKESLLYSDAGAEDKYYFVHSYHVVCDDEKDVMTKTNYGYDFVSSFQKENIVGVQFHPEKSHRFGTNLFRNFVEDFKS